MKEEDIVARVGAHVREERELEPDPEAVRPLGDDAVDRIVSRVAAPKAAKAPASGKVIAFPRWARTYAAPILVAAAVVLFIASRDHGNAGPALPGYGVTAVGERALRGDAPKSNTLRIGKDAASRFEIVARPETSVGDAKIVAYAFAMEGNDPVALDAKIEVSKDGAVRVTGDARAVRSANEIRVVLMTPEGGGTFDRAMDRAKAGRSDSQARVVSVVIQRD